MGLLKNHVKGTLPADHRGGCGNCGHSAVKPGCACAAEWCACHRAAKGHGAWGCDCRDKARARLAAIKKASS
jgi:hypothetical protein